MCLDANLTFLVGMVSKLQPSKIFTILSGGHFEKCEKKSCFSCKDSLGLLLVDIGTIRDSKLLAILSRFPLYMGYLDQINTWMFWSGVEWSGVEWSGVEWSGVEK